jgi:hypothetical protein
LDTGGTSQPPSCDLCGPPPAETASPADAAVGDAPADGTAASEEGSSLAETGVDTADGGRPDATGDADVAAPSNCEDGLSCDPQAVNFVCPGPGTIGCEYYCVCFTLPDGGGVVANCVEGCP